MARCRVDSSIQRVEVEGFAFPLGVYPVEDMKPRAGYTVTFEPADGGESEDAGDPDGDPEDRPPVLPGTGGNGGVGPAGGGDWEEWPDRYVYDILVSATRVEALCRALFTMLPGRIYPILDVLGHDEYREVDPYVSYDLIGLDRFLDALRRFRGFFYEDGLVGFGAMSDEPFIYIFVDEHKIVTVRVETALREKVEAVLNAFDLEEIEEIAGADAATHEHRGVLDSPDGRLDLLTAEEIVEDLRDEWGLVLNIDPESNLDAEGNELGMTGWRCILRHDPSEAPKQGDVALATAPPMSRYAEILLTADSLNQAEDLALEAMEALLAKPKRRKKVEEAAEDDEESEELEPVVVAADRLEPEHFLESLKAAGRSKVDMSEAGVWHSGWMT